ncbi:hypothetical protein SE18_11420 [Herpetosiphon geysericola]|uniref:Uncharacterized protein n=1 Tax=Herpetosiphon geysericola TaxID=70996 RepID=A0A0P6YTS9_9CHLR|nr:hypothetical protein SE18_11420 [Herpetosiphon geysericola]
METFTTRFKTNVLVIQADHFASAHTSLAQDGEDEAIGLHGAKDCHIEVIAFSPPTNGCGQSMRRCSSFASLGWVDQTYPVANCPCKEPTQAGCSSIAGGDGCIVLV